MLGLGLGFGLGYIRFGNVICVLAVLLLIISRLNVLEKYSRHLENLSLIHHTDQNRNK